MQGEVTWEPGAGCKPSSADPGMAMKFSLVKITREDTGDEAKPGLQAGVQINGATAQAQGWLQRSCCVAWGENRGHEPQG